jgi:hypothetical protein
MTDCRIASLFCVSGHLSASGKADALKLSVGRWTFESISNFPRELEFVQSFLSIWSWLVVCMIAPHDINPNRKRHAEWSVATLVSSFECDQLFTLQMPFVLLHVQKKVECIKKFLLINSKFAVLMQVPLLADPLP